MDPEKLSLSDISPWDMKIIVGMAQQTFIDTSADLSECMIQAVLDYIHARGFDIVLNPDREATWSKRANSLYLNQTTKKGSWQI